MAANGKKSATAKASEEDYSIDDDEEYSEDASNNAPLDSLPNEKPKLTVSPSKALISPPSMAQLSKPNLSKPNLMAKKDNKNVQEDAKQKPLDAEEKKNILILNN